MEVEKRDGDTLCHGKEGGIPPLLCGLTSRKGGDTHSESWFPVGRKKKEEGIPPLLWVMTSLKRMGIPPLLCGSDVTREIALVMS